MSPPDPTSLVLGIVVSLMIGLGVVILVGRRGQALVPSVTSFFLHVAVAAFLLYYHGIGALGPDAFTYDGLGQQEALTMGVTGSSAIDSFTAGKEGWIVILGFIYSTFGHIPEIPLILLATLMGCVPAIMAITSRDLGWEDSANTSAWFAVLLPPMILWSSVLLREGAAIFLLSAMVLSLGWFQRGRALGAGVLLLAAAGGMMWIRPPVGFAALVAILIGAVVFPQRVSSGVGRVFLYVLPSLLAIPLGLTRGNQLDLSQAGTLRQNLAMGATTSTGATSVGWDTPVGAAWESFKTMPQALIGPFPWEWPSQPWQVNIDAVTFAVLAALCVVAVIRTTQKREALRLLLPALAIIFVIAAALGNYGFGIRQRSQAVPFIIPVAAAGWVLLRRKHANSAPDLTQSSKHTPRSMASV